MGIEDESPYEQRKWERVLFDAMAFSTEGGMSSPLGPDDEFEVYIEELT